MFAWTVLELGGPKVLEIQDLEGHTPTALADSLLKGIF